MLAAILRGAPIRASRTVTWIILALVLLSSCAEPLRAEEIRWWSEAAERALAAAGTNRAQLTAALTQVPLNRRDGMQFLVEQMPQPDLRRLTAEFLLENVQLAYDAFDRAPWASRVPKSIFLNDVLPYASLNERRDNWRRLLHSKSIGFITNCATPGEAAHRLNQKLFKDLNVRYSTQRRRADQGPLETMETGVATCTGLSILLVDACRAVGVPARVAATPMWSNNRGNHTWVEIWDQGWHFAGAAEPDIKGLDRGWFVGDASRAEKDIPEHAIYASSFARTGLSFPLVWATEIGWVNAENVTERYAARLPSTDTNRVLLQVKVLDKPDGKRVAAKVSILDAAEPGRRLDGTSRDESVDLNDILPFHLQRGRAYEVQVELGDRRLRRNFQAGTNRQELLVLAMNAPSRVLLPSQACYLPPRVARELSAKDAAKLNKAMNAYFAAPTNQQDKWKFAGKLDRLLMENEPAVRRAAWEAFKAAPIHATRRADYDTNQVRFEKYRSPYTIKTVGTRPANGWPLFIAMHGGGGAPKEVNDSQWKIMQRYYRDHPEVGGYRYLALRAPNDSWNGFYDTYVYPLIANLIGQFLLFGDVDANKVFIMGYSHGGYGAFAIGPKIPDRFAAIHASAAAPTDGETTPSTLKNTVFTCMVGEKDTAYGRFDRNKKFRDAVQQLRGERTDIYPVRVEIIEGNGHTGLPDRDKILSMYPAVRNPVPRELTWLQTDKVVSEFFWLRATPAKRQEINATCSENRIVVTTTTNVTSAGVLLDSRLVDFKSPVMLEVNGRSSKLKLKPSLKVLCQTLQRRMDPELAFSAQVGLALATPPKK